MEPVENLTLLPLPEKLADHGLKLYYTQGDKPERWSHDALLNALRLYTGRVYQENDILREPGKKPVLLDDSVQFSVTHSGDYWMVCLAPAHMPVGLDLQVHKEKYSPAVAKRYFHPEELALLEQAKETHTDTALFFDLWCARESYAKYTGAGITGLDKNFSTTRPPVTLYPLKLQTGYSLFLCTKLLDRQGGLQYV